MACHTSILTVKGACEAPLISLQWTQIEDFNNKQVTRVRRLLLCVCDRNGTAEVVHLQQR